MNVCSNMGKQLVCPAYCRLVNSSLMAGRNPLKTTFRHFTISPARKGKLETHQKAPIATVEVQITENEGIEKSTSKLKLQTSNLYSGTAEKNNPDSIAEQLSSSMAKSGSEIISESTILQAEDPEVLLQISSSARLSLKQACLVISSLGRLAKLDKLNFENIKNDKRFTTMCNLVLRGNHSQQPHNLLTAMYGLRNLGFSKNSEIHKTLESELMWGMRRCPVRYLARVVDVVSEEENHPPNVAAKEPSLLHITVETLQRRWVEIASGSEFIVVFKVIHLLADDTKAKLEDRAVEMVPEFTAMEMVKLLVILGVQKRRPTPLLRAIAYHLSKKEIKIPVKDLIELVYALNELTFSEPILMAKLSESIVEQLSSVNSPSLISSLVTSLGQMRYKNKELIQALEESISKSINSLRTFDCASYLLTSAVLNIPVENNTEFYLKAKSLLVKPLEESPAEWVNIVHSFAVVNQCTPELLSSVLQSNFIEQMDAACGKMKGPLVKLLNLNAIAKHKLVKDYNGPTIDKSYVSKWTANVRPSDPILSKVVVDTLGNFLPLPKYLKTNKQLECGVYIDAVCMLNEKSEPVPVEVGNTKKDWTKVAIILLGYPSLCLGIKDPTGSTLLNIKLLKCEGYKIMAIPYTEFSAQEKIVKRVQYLEQRIKLISSIKSSGKSEPESSR